MWASTRGSVNWSAARRAADKLCLPVPPKVNALCAGIDRPCRRGHARPLHKTCPP